MTFGENVTKWLDEFRRRYGSDSPAYVADMLAAHEYLRESLEEAVRKDGEEA